MGYFDDLVTEYLRLSFEFPEKKSGELLLLFRESMKEGKVSISFPDFPKKISNHKDPQHMQAGLYFIKTTSMETKLPS